MLEEARLWAKATYVSSFEDSNDFEDFFAQDKATKDSLSVLCVSANDKDSLLNYVEALRKHLIYPAVRIDVQDLAFTLSERRTHHLHRGFFITKKPVFDSRTLVLGRKSLEPPRIGFVFTGQGAQWPGMGKLLVEEFPLAEQMLRHLDSVLQQCPSPPSWSLLGKCLPS